MRKLRFILAGLVIVGFSALAEEGVDFFEKKIRPVLVERCYKCHSDRAKKLKGDYRLDFRGTMRRGGDSGKAAVVPGKPGESQLITALEYLNSELKMSIPVVVDDSEPDEYAESLPPGPERSQAMRDWEFSFHEGPNECGEWDGDEDGFFEENKEEVCLDCVTELSVIYNGYDETRIILKADSQCSDCESTLCFNEKFEIIGKVVKGEKYCNRCVAKRIDSLKKKISNLQGSIDEEVENIEEEIQEFGGKVDDDSLAGLGALFG